MNTSTINNKSKKPKDKIISTVPNISINESRIESGPHIFSNIYINEKVLLNTEEQLYLVNQYLESNSIEPENIITILNFIKNFAKKNKNLNIDPIFCFSYVNIKFHMKLAQNLAAKILFQYANLYNDLNENMKSCYAIIKHFDMEKKSFNNLEHSKKEGNICHNLNSHSYNNKTSITKEYNQIYTTISHIQGELLLMEEIKFALNSLNLEAITLNDFKMNFLILLINNLSGSEWIGSSSYRNISYHTDLIKFVFDFLIQNKKILYTHLSSMHFNNLIKVTCKINEYLLKMSQIKLSMEVKLFLYEMLLESKLSESLSVMSFLTNHVNELLILQQSHNWRKVLQENPSFLEVNYIYKFFDFISIKIELIVNKDIVDISNLLGKIYNFYNNFGNLEINKVLIYSTKILDFYKSHKIIINETLMIKSNLFKEYLNENKSNITNHDVLVGIKLHIEELTVIIHKLKQTKAKEDFFILIIKFLKKCFENLLTLSLNLISNEELINFRTVLPSIEKLFEVLLSQHSSILSKSNSESCWEVEKEFNQFIIFYNYIKLLELQDTNSSLFKLIFQKVVNSNSSTDTLDENKIIIITYHYTLTNQLNQVVFLHYNLSKFNYDLYFSSIISFLSTMDKHSSEIINKFNDFSQYVDKICLILAYLEKEGDSKPLKYKKLEIEMFFYKLERILTYIFNHTFIRDMSKNLKSNDKEKFSQIYNLFLNYYKTLSSIIEKLKLNYNFIESHISLLILLDFLEVMFSTNSPIAASFILEFSKSGLKEIIPKSNTDYLAIIESFCLDYCILTNKSPNDLEIKYNLKNKNCCKSFIKSVMFRQLELLKNFEKSKLDLYTSSSNLFLSIEDNYYSEYYEKLNKMNKNTDCYTDLIHEISVNKLNQLKLKEDNEYLNAFNNLLGISIENKEKSIIFNNSENNLKIVIDQINNLYIKTDLCQHNQLIPEIFDIVDYFIFGRSSTKNDSNFKSDEKYFDESVTILTEMIKKSIKGNRMMSVPEWIIYLDLQYYNAYKNTKSIYNSNEYLDDALSFLKKLFDFSKIKFFFNNLIEEVNTTKKFLKIKSTIKIFNHDKKLYTYLGRIIRNIKKISMKTFPLCYKQNMSDDFFYQFYSISKLFIFSLDNIFLSCMIVNIIRFLRKWTRKYVYVYNPEKSDLKCPIQYAICFYKLILVYLTVNYKYNVNLQDSIPTDNSLKEIDKIIEFFVNFNYSKFDLSNYNDYHIFKSIFYYLEFNNRTIKFNTVLNLTSKRDKYIYMRSIFNNFINNKINCEEEINESIEYNNVNIKKEYLNLYHLNKIDFEAISYFKNNFLDINKKHAIIFCLKIFKADFEKFLTCEDKLKKLIQVFKNSINNNDLNNIQLIEHLKYIKKIISILLSWNLGNNNTYPSLIKFYTKYLINYKLHSFYHQSKSNVNGNIVKDDINFISFFRCKNYYFLSVNFKGKFAYTSILSNELNPLLNNLKSVFTDINTVKEIKDKCEWWNQRKKSEKNLESALINIQNLLINNKNIKEVIKLIYLSNTKFMNLFSSCNKLETILDDLVSLNTSKKNHKMSQQSHQFIKNFYNKNSSIIDMYDESNLTYLVVSSELANYPIENLPIFYKLPILRVLHYKMISSQIKKTEILNKSNTFYLVNPSQDLKDTEATLSPLLSCLFNGISGKEPENKQIESNLSTCKLFIYCGHSNGTKYIEPSYIRRNTDFISLLMGCSSVKIESLSKKDSQPIDITTYYQMNKCPALLGCLWDVTDIDLDRFLKTVIETIFVEKRTSSLLEAVLIAKHVCSFRYLNSASIVLYSSSDLRLISD